MLTLYLTSLLMPIYDHLLGAEKSHCFGLLSQFRRINITSTSLIRMSGYYISIAVRVISLVQSYPFLYF